MFIVYRFVCYIFSISIDCFSSCVCLSIVGRERWREQEGWRFIFIVQKRKEKWRPSCVFQDCFWHFIIDSDIYICKCNSFAADVTHNISDSEVPSCCFVTISVILWHYQSEMFPYIRCKNLKHLQFGKTVASDSGFWLISGSNTRSVAHFWSHKKVSS